MRDAEKDRREILDDEELPLEKNDTFAMLVSGFLIIGLPCLALIGIIIAVVLLLFG